MEDSEGDERGGFQTLGHVRPMWQKMQVMVMGRGIRQKHEGSEYNTWWGNPTGESARDT